MVAGFEAMLPPAKEFQDINQGMSPEATRNREQILPSRASRKNMTLPTHIFGLGLQNCERIHFWVFPTGRMDKNQPANAGDTSSDPWSGKIPLALQQLSPCPQLLSPSSALRARKCNYWAHMPRARSMTREATVVKRLHTAVKSNPLSPQLEKVQTQQQRPNTAKTK